MGVDLSEADDCATDRPNIESIPDLLSIRNRPVLLQ